MMSIRKRDSRIFGLAISSSLIISLLASALLISNMSIVQAQFIQTWSDTFADTSKIESLNNATQVTDVGEFGTSFTPYSGNPLLSLETCDPWDADGDDLYQIPGAVHADVLYFSEGMDGYKFWMVYTPAPETGSVPPGAPPNPGSSGYPDWYWERCTLVRSNDGINWVKTPDYTNPLIAPEGPGEWDDDHHCDPDFVYAPGKGPGGESWFLYWCGVSPMSIGVALSHDGKSYTKYAGNPVMPPGGSNTRCPAVIYNETTGIFHGWYNWGSFEIGYATSTDGVTWTPYNPTSPGAWGYVVFRGTPGTFDAHGITHMDVVYHEGQYWMYYLAVPTGAYAGLLVGLATSPDGISWTQHPEPVLTPGETWTFYNPDWLGGNFTSSVQSLYRPAAVVVEDMMYLYYGGTDDYTAYPAHNYEIGLAFSSLTGPDGHVELEKHVEPSEYADRPSETVAWYHMNEGPPVMPPPLGEYTPKDPTLAWYHFNEGTGITAGDSSGNDNNGTLVGPPTWTTGLYDVGLSFDGDDRVTVPHSPELNPTENLTMEAWVNPSVRKSNSYVAIKMTAGGSDYSYGMKLENQYSVTYSEIGAFIVNSAGDLYFAYGGNVPTGTWTHIAMTYEMNSTGSTHIKLYQNGVEVSYRYGDPGEATDTIPASTAIRSNTGPLTIGCIPVATPLYYQGVMDEVRILGRALTAEEIAADGYWAVPTSTVLDSSSNENHGSPTSGVSWTTGMFSYGLDFDGSTGYVYIPYNESLDVADELTIEAWVNLDMVDATYMNNFFVCRVSSDAYPPDDAAFGFKVDFVSGAAGLEGWIWHTEPGMTGDEPYFRSESNVVPPLGTWAFIAMTYNSSEGRIRLYVNGVETPYSMQMQVPGDGRIDTPADIPLVVGYWNPDATWWGAPPMDGRMDELRILNRSLTPSEILADYGASYKNSGNITSVSIAPNSTWSTFYAMDESPPGTSIEYSILNEAGEVLMAHISNNTDISSLVDTPIRLNAELATSDASSTPILHEWSVTYEAPEPPNTPPSASNLAITPSPPETTDDLVGSYAYYDADDNLEFGTEIRWYKDDVPQPAYNDVLTVSSASTTPGEEWYFTVRPSDGVDFGDLETSPSVTIIAPVFYIFSEGFESGDFSAWDSTVGASSVTSGGAHCGAYKAEFPTTADYCSYDDDYSDDLYLRAYVKFSHLPDDSGDYISIMHIGRTGSYHTVRAILYNDGTDVVWGMEYRTGRAYSTQQKNPSVDTWYCVEVMHHWDGYYNNDYSMWVDGSKLSDIDVVDDGTLTHQPDSCRVGTMDYVGMPSGSTLYADCVVLSGEYIGPEGEPPPDTTLPTYSDVGTNSTVAGEPCLFYSRWLDNVELSGYIFSTNNTGTWTNDTWTPLSGSTDWSNVTKTLSSTIGALVQYQFYCNDTSDNWASTPIQALTVTGDVTPPTYSDIGTNTTEAGQQCLFYSRWLDNVELSGYIFSTNNTGTWTNDTWTPLSGSTDWSNVTKTLSSTIGALVQYQFYCNDTSDNWASTPIQALTVTQPIVWYDSELSLFVSSSPALVGYKVNILGNLTYMHDGSGVPSSPVQLYYRFTGGESWNIITSTTTASDGRYYVTWFPMRTGDYIIRAVYAGEETPFGGISGTETIVNMIITDIEEQVFSVSSNSTMSSLTFNSTAREITFIVEGPSDTTGYLNIFLSKDLTPDIDDVRIYFDNVEVNYEAVSVDDVWFVHLTYHHSTHTLRINLSSTSPTHPLPATTLTLIIVAALIASFTALALLLNKEWFSNRTQIDPKSDHSLRSFAKSPRL